MSAAGASVSVVIPSYNSESTMRACLDSVFNQTLEADRYEVIVVDSSTDATPEIVSREYPGARLIRLERKTLPGPARNIGVKHCRTGLVMFIDSDCVAERDVLRRVLNRHEKGEWAVVGGAILNGTPGSAVGWVDYLMSFSPFLPSMEEKTVPQLPTCNACYRIDILSRQGGFPAYNFLAEDLILNWRIFSGGGRLLFDPSIRVIHVNRTGMSDHLKHQYKLGWSFALALRCTDMPRNSFARYPGLAVLFPVSRFGALVARVARRDRRVLAFSLALLPLYLVGASAWAFGFFRGASMGEKEFQDRLEAV